MQESTSLRLGAAEGENKILKGNDKKYEARVHAYTIALRDVEHKHKMGKLKYDALNKSSQIVMKKIMAITMKLKKAQISNEQWEEDYKK